MDYDRMLDVQYRAVIYVPAEDYTTVAYVRSALKSNGMSKHKDIRADVSRETRIGLTAEFYLSPDRTFSIKHGCHRGLVNWETMLYSLFPNSEL